MHPEDYNEMISDERFIKASNKNTSVLDYKIDGVRITINPSKNQIWIDKWHYNSWASPGDSFIDFLISINKYYFIDKVFPNMEVFDKKATLAAFRKKLNEFCPSYKSPQFMKEIRFEIRSKECHMANPESFVSEIMSIDIGLDYNIYHLNSTAKTSNFNFDDFKYCFQEPWHFIIKKNSQYVEAVCKAFAKLQKQLASEKPQISANHKQS
jgi:hypothetical protein